MNTIGKILVVLNFLFAVIVGVVMVMVTSMRTPWKEAYEELKKQSVVVVAQRDAYAKVNVNLANDFRSAKEREATILQDLKDRDVALAEQRKLDALKNKEFENQALAAQTALNQALITTKRQADEIAVLNKTIGEREKLIVNLEADNKVVRVQAQNFEGLARARQIQNENLLEQVREYTQHIARLESGVNPNTMVVRDPNAPNPPPVTVNGRVELVDDKDATLIQITLGTDHGVNKYHTLDVYRTKPEPKYIGMVRIVEAYHQKSVAQLVTSGSAAYRQQVRPDDLVTSKLSPR
jgi:hypothetical protein